MPALRHVNPAPTPSRMARVMSCIGTTRVVEEAAEQERLWSFADRVFPGFAVYRRDAAAAGRQIPLISVTAS